VEWDEAADPLPALSPYPTDPAVVISH
jgi:hypothetical protein